MTGWKAKRFWKAVTVVQEGGGFAVRLDARPVKTPAKRPLVLPTRAMAEAVAAEWAAVDNAIDPRRMPVTRAANAAIDKVATQFDEVAAMIAAYGASDLLCYRATAADPLARAQAEAWDPMLAWAERTYGARLATTEGVVPIAQPAEAVARLAKLVFACSPFQLAALHDLVALTGSLVLGLAATGNGSDPDDLWRLSRFDEDWQAALWGEDEEATEAAERKRRDFLLAVTFWRLAGMPEA
ncbi:MAG: ATPase [Rhodobacteraceae bacterium]|jgi:chaperone required for assembly of F1-ATPase|uniref:ATP12 family chaperone protein n=1 Tax=Albidovulum sp. TaxID=1872424 RepID=UPI001D76A553|nr:ATP12 family protein [uncultured Defluviimonas sp.]MCB2126781.1 ATPase [Paracoccaceae bacterium]MCC0069412.1 ATPase [Paracoccaceae bacterium]